MLRLILTVVVISAVWIFIRSSISGISDQFFTPWSNGQPFTLAPIESGYDGNPGAYDRFHGLSEDAVTHTTSRRWLAWPLIEVGLQRLVFRGAARRDDQRGAAITIIAVSLERKATCIAHEAATRAESSAS